MTNKLTPSALVLFFLILEVFYSNTNDLALALEHPETELDTVNINPELGKHVTLGLSFKNEDGEVSSLSEYLSGGVPLIIVPVYYRCPRLCGLVMDGVVNLVKELELSVGKEYRLISVSFDPTESVEMARGAAVKFRGAANLDTTSTRSWRFLVGAPDATKTLMNEIGFHYREDRGEYAHGAAIIILTPEGQISQYFTGIKFSPWDVRLALVEASQGKLGSALDHILLFCFRFDPTQGRYTWAAFNLVRVGGILTFILLTVLVIRLLRGERTASSH